MPEKDGYARAYLVDSEAQYAIADVVERLVIRPAIFRAFGWEVEQVLGKDWLLRGPNEEVPTDRNRS